MRSTTIAFLAAFVLAFIPPGVSTVFAEEGAEEVEAGWHGTFHDHLEEHTTFWDGKGKITGQIRFRAESFNDFDFDDDTSTDSKDDDFLLSRIRLAVDLKPNEIIRLYFQLQDSHQFETDVPAAFRIGPAAREDRVDIYQAFADVKPLPDVPLTVRAGRQILTYGNQRLVGGFGWSNTSRSFNAVKVMYDREWFFLDAFGSNVVIPEDRHFNTESHDDNFFGLYGGWREFPGGVLEAYLFIRDDDRAGQGREIYTFGTRLQGNCPANEAIDYSVELIAQIGDLPAGVDQEAFAAHVGAGYTFKNNPHTPRLGIEYNFSTGDDDPADGDKETLDNLFPTNHLHYGYMDLFSLRNIHNLRLSASAKPVEKVTVKADLHFFWLDDTSDAWYNAGGGVVRPATPGADDFVGEEIDLTAIYKHNTHLAFMAGYSHFFAGDFVEDTGTDDDADWLYLQATFSF